MLPYILYPLPRYYRNFRLLLPRFSRRAYLHTRRLYQKKHLVAERDGYELRSIKTPF